MWTIYSTNESVALETAFSDIARENDEENDEAE
jgi:hypothetical protein